MTGNMSDSKFPPGEGDTNRTADVHITCDGHTAEAPMRIDGKRYHGLIAGLRIAEEHLFARIGNEKFPGVNKDRVALWRAQREEIIEVLCCFDI